VAVGQKTNRWKKVVTQILAKELTSASDSVIYTVAAGNDDAHPIVIMQGSTLEEIRCDKTSQKYADSLKISVAEIGDANVAAGLPHKICKWTISG
jgi:hypothetical protein